MTARDPNAPERISGTVDWFNVEKGFGFILPDDASFAVRVQTSDVRRHGSRALDEGDRVSFVRVNSPRGPVARDVVRLDRDLSPPARVTRPASAAGLGL